MTESNTPTVVADFNATIWSVDMTDDPSGIEIYLADEDSNTAVVVRLEGYFTRPIDGSTDVTVHARSEDFAREVAAYSGIKVEDETYYSI